MRTRILATVLGFSMDLIALWALSATSEVFPLTLGVVAVLFVTGLLLRTPVLGRRSGLMLGTAFFTGLTAAAIFLAGLLWLKFHLPLIVAVANSVPVLHAALWLMTDRTAIARSAQLRLAVGFSELLVAAILTSGVFLTIAIFFFSILASIAVSTSYLDAAFQEHGESEPILTPRYLSNSLVLAVIILLSSLLIFPVLPRTRVGLGVEAAARQTGYTEQVRLDRLSETLGTGRGRVLLKISRTGVTSNPEELSSAIHLGLLRTRTLNSFDGTQWFPGAVGSHGRRPMSDLSGKVVWLDLSREAMPTDALPVPYGTVHLIPKDERSRIVGRLNGEFLGFGPQRSTFNYQVGLKTGTSMANFGSTGDDVPRGENYEIPKSLNNGRMRGIAKAVFGASRKTDPPDIRVERLRNYYRENKFAPSLGGLSQTDQRLSPIEYFMIVERAGNCELFASSAAMLLRFAGIATRLVAGFRLSRGTEDASLVVRSGDAHAWLEYFVPGKGWRVFDPTPRLLQSYSFWSRILDGYDWVEGYWYQHFYSFDAASQAELGTRTLHQLRDSASWTPSRGDWGRDLLDWLKGGQGLAALSLVLSGAGVLLALLIRAALDAARDQDGGLRRIPFLVRLHLLRAGRIFRLSLSGRSACPPLDLLRLESFFLSKHGQEGVRRYSDWREAYLNARFKPGSKISYQDLAEKLGEVARLPRA